VGDDKIYIWDGSSWTLDNEFNSSTMQIDGIAYFSSDSVWIAAWNSSTFKGIYRWDGFTWNQELSGKGCFSVEALSSDNVFVGCGGAVMRWDGNEWIEFSIVGSIRDLYFNSPTEGWAMSENGNIFYWNGFGWSLWENSLETFFKGTAIYATSPNNVWAAALKGEESVCTKWATVWHWDGIIWNPRRCSANTGTSPPVSYYGIEGSGSSNIWMVGTAGKIRHWDGSDIQVVNSPTESTIYGIDVQSITSAGAVGENGIILRYVE